MKVLIKSSSTTHTLMLDWERKLKSEVLKGEGCFVVAVLNPFQLPLDKGMERNTDPSPRELVNSIHQFDLRPRLEKFFKILFYKIFDLRFGWRAIASFHYDIAHDIDLMTT